MDYTSAQNADHFELPDELIVRFLNVTREDVHRGCVRQGRCLAEKKDAIRGININAGQRMINNFPSVIREWPTQTDADWDELILHRCTANVPMGMLLAIDMEITWACILRERHVPRENIQRFQREWIREYCARVGRL